MRSPIEHRPDVAPLSKADTALQQAMVVLAPLVRWLLRSGVNYVAVSQALKTVFLDEGRRELARTGGKMTDSALSVLSGVHRKDVRALESASQARGEAVVTPAARVVARWLTAPAYRDPGSSPQKLLERLPRSGAAPSFESLAREVSNDVHPRTLLEEMIRLGVVTVEGEYVALALDQFNPDVNDPGPVAMLAGNAADHLAAAVHNLTVAEGPRFLEQSVFAQGLSETSVNELGALARELWRPALQSMVEAASERVRVDKPVERTPMRMRFGVYYYFEDSDRAREAGPLKDHEGRDGNAQQAAQAAPEQQAAAQTADKTKASRRK
jgi:hypothetical protein